MLKRKEKKIIILISFITIFICLMVLLTKYINNQKTQNPAEQKAEYIEEEIEMIAEEINNYLESGAIEEEDLLIEGYNKRIRAEIEVFYEDQEFPDNPFKEEEFLNNIADPDLKRDIRTFIDKLEFIKTAPDDYIIKFNLSFGTLVLPRKGQNYEIE